MANKKALEWVRVTEDGLRAEESDGEWLISRNRVLGETVYTLWHNHDRLGQYATAKDAQDAADNHLP